MANLQKKTKFPINLFRATLFSSRFPETKFLATFEVEYYSAAEDVAQWGEYSYHIKSIFMSPNELFSMDITTHRGVFFSDSEVHNQIITIIDNALQQSPIDSIMGVFATIAEDMGSDTEIDEELNDLYDAEARDMDRADELRKDETPS